MEFDFSPVADLQIVPEQFRPLYGTAANAEGKFAVADAFKGTVEAFGGLGRALKAERAAAKNRTTVDLSALSEYGDSPEKIAEAVKAKVNSLAEQLAAGGKINVDKIKQDIEAGHKSELTKRDARNQALQDQLYELLVDNAAVTALASFKGSSDLLLPIVRKSVKVAEQDGKFSVFVVDKDNARRYSGVTGQPMSIVELVAELKADKRYAQAFASEARSGGGMEPGSGKGTRAAAVLTTTGEKSSIDKIKAGIAKGALRPSTAQDRA